MGILKKFRISIRHLPFTSHHSPFTIQHSPFTILRLPLPLQEWPDRRTLGAGSRRIGGQATTIVGMSTAKRLVLSLRGRKNSQGNSATSSTRLVSAGTSPGHELDEIAVVSGTGSSSHHFSYGGCLATGDAPLPRYSTGECPPTIHHPNIHVYNFGLQMRESSTRKSPNVDLPPITNHHHHLLWPLWKS